MRPLARFKTKIWRYNVKKDKGEICFDYNKSNWKKENTIRESILSVFNLLTYSNFGSK